MIKHQWLFLSLALLVRQHSAATTAYSTPSAIAMLADVHGFDLMVRGAFDADLMRLDVVGGGWEGARIGRRLAEEEVGGVRGMVAARLQGRQVEGS